MSRKTHENKPLRQASELLPSDEDILRILKIRSTQLAKIPLEASRVDNLTFYIDINLGGKNTYGVPYQYVREILPFVPIAKVPFVPEFIAGVINHRGSLIFILDLIKLFQIESSKVETNYIVVTESNEIMIGLLVENINGNFNYDPLTLHSPLIATETIKTEYILGLHNGRTALLNFDRILNDVKGVMNEYDQTK